MIPTLRQAYNQSFTQEKYRAFLDWIAGRYDHRPPFRIAETPVFIPHKLKEHLLQASEEIIDVIVRPDFKELTQGSILPGHAVPNETPHTTFLQMDFGICRDADGEFFPQLIEVQGFPSLYFFQHLLGEAYRRHFDIPAGMSPRFHGLDEDSYVEMLRKAILGGHKAENVILMEVDPRNQATEIDFMAAKEMLGIEYHCISDLKVEGRDVYYVNAQGRRVKVEKIFNRVIFDELNRRADIQPRFNFFEDYDMDWAGHPNWFFRISKHTLPLLDSRYVPKSYYLNELQEIPEDLHNYVLKPLYSFAGTGVIINLNRFDLEGIPDPANYILQRKVEYAPVIPTPDVPSKCEIRMLMLWEREAPRPVIVNNLARLSKGEMVGTRYNRDKEWVGGSVGFFE
jgi:hypothetical protein